MSRILAMVGPPSPGLRGLDGQMRHALGVVPGPRNERTAERGWLASLGSGGGVAECEGIVVAIDGRIFNRDEIGLAGTDAEVVARLIRSEGPAAAMRRLNADISVVCWEPAAGRLSIARDRWGMRPLYWAAGAGLVAAASRPRPLLGLPGVRVEPDPFFVARIAGSHYRTFDNDPERSPYRDIEQVPAASVVSIEVSPSGRVGPPRTERYWHLDGTIITDATEAELAERYRELLIDAVARRVAVAPRPAFTLSGGMDSSSVLASAVRATGQKQRAYSTVYADPTYDERTEIATMLDGCVDTWRPIEIGVPDVFGTVARMVAAHDEPVATATWLSHQVLGEVAASEGVLSILGGLGGDELNAGEFEYFPCHFADLAAAGRLGDLYREIAGWAEHHDHPIFRKDASVAAAMMARIADPSRAGHIRADRERIDRYAAALAPSMPSVRGFAPVMEHPFRTLLQNRTWQDLTRETMPCCLRAEDRNLAPLGLERFHPFLDHRLAELMFRVPGKMKIRDGVTKRLLREAMRGVLPEETRTRIAKTGWNAPAHVWFSGENREPLMDLIHSRAFRERGVYDHAEVVRLANEHEQIVASGEPRENHMMFFWQLVNVELWLQDVDGLRVETTSTQALAA
jgi:asparagine synthase (glutamine-hydrolysing)